MPGKMAIVNYDRCCPENCDGGICAAALACSRKLLRQEAPYEAPMADPSPCKGCSDCALACPQKAIEMARM